MDFILRTKTGDSDTSRFSLRGNKKCLFAGCSQERKTHTWQVAVVILLLKNVLRSLSLSLDFEKKLSNSPIK